MNATSGLHEGKEKTGGARGPARTPPPPVTPGLRPAPAPWPRLLTIEQAQDVARATMLCETCEWATRVGDECAEQAFVKGCIHWKRRAST